MNFPNEYFEDEIKNGYFVDGRMKCCWAVQVDVLQVVDKLCKKHNIPYFAEWGTLLGTVRHGGFIPWDDDFDISMKRQDYERFLKIAHDELKEPYAIMSYKTDPDYYDVMARVLNSTRVNFEGDFLEKNHNFPYTAGIDIFPLDYLARDKSLVDAQRELVELVKTTADTYGIRGMEKDELEFCLAQVEKLCKQKIDRDGDIKAQLYKILCGLYAIYTDKESDEIGLIPVYLENGGGSVYPKACYADSVRMPFENTTIPVPIGYDQILKKKYGDYMKSVRKGGTHDYPYFEKQEEFIIKEGVELPKYTYENQEGKKKKPAFREALAQKIELLISMHEKIEQLVKIGENEYALQLLQGCQELAIAMGNSIERKVADPSPVVGELEQYCEMLFELHGVLSEQDGVNATGVRVVMDEALQHALDQIMVLDIKREVVFMPYKPAHWSVLEKLWQEAVADPANDVKVIPLPYFYKKNLGLDFGEMQYDGDKFPEYVPITNCEEYDMEINHPDVIYIQNPCDQWNYSVQIHVNFHSGHLWENTEQLVYIPWFKIDEMNPADERGLKSMNYFVPMPGVVNADRVILQSEEMKQSYVDYLSRWAGEETRSIWEEKISGDGGYLYENMDVVDKPEEWKGKKVLLFHVSANGLLEHKGKIVKKIEKSLQMFEDNADKLQIIWLQDLMPEDKLKKRVPTTNQNYKKILGKMRRADHAWITVMPANETDMAVKMADAFYGDAGRAAKMVQQAGKPVMIMNVDV